MMSEDEPVTGILTRESILNMQKALSENNTPQWTCLNCFRKVSDNNPLVNYGLNCEGCVTDPDIERANLKIKEQLRGIVGDSK